MAYLRTIIRHIRTRKTNCIIVHVTLREIFSLRKYTQDSQRSFNVTMRRVRVTIVAMEKKLLLHNLCVYL